MKTRVPIKKIIISSGTANHNNRFRIIVKNFSIDIFNTENTKIDINKVPNMDSQKDGIYETDWCDIGEIAQIEFLFIEPISDYRIKLEYEVESTQKSEFANSKVIIVDEQYRKYIIDNFNFTFNYKYITGETIKKFTKPNLDTKSNIDNYNFVTNGVSIKTDINKVNNSKNDFYSYEEEVESMENENRYILLKGGNGGGGHCYSDRKSDLIISSGGGGFIGGNSKIGRNNDEYCGGQGGMSFIEDINFKGDWYNFSEDAFVNNLNDGNGFIVIQKINKRVSQNEYKPKKNIQKNSNANSNTNSNEFDTSRFFNRNVEKFFGGELDKQRVITPLNSLANSSRFDLKSDNINTEDNNILLEIKVDNSQFDRICLVTNSLTSSYSIMFIGWNSNEYSRYLIDIPSNSYQEDDITQLNHGLDKINRTKLEKYFKLITKNNIYRHTNTIKSETDINKGFNYKLTSMKNYVYYSKTDLTDNVSSDNVSSDNVSSDNVSSNVFNEIINIKPEYDKLFVLIQFDSKQKNKLDYVLNKFNSKTENDSDIKKRTQYYL